MRKIPVSDRSQQPEIRAQQPAAPEPTTSHAEPREGDEEDPMAGLQADLDRFRDLAMRSQADFENYKKRCAREKEDAIKYANGSLLKRLVAIVDNFELGLEAARGESEQSPIYSGMTLVLKQLRDFLAENGL